MKLAYDDDRREKQMRDEMEKQRRDAVALARARAAEESPRQPEAELQDENVVEPLHSTLPLHGGDLKQSATARAEHEYDSEDMSDVE